jgi:hypothetical protein
MIKLSDEEADIMEDYIDENSLDKFFDEELERMSYISYEMGEDNYTDNNVNVE